MMVVNISTRIIIKLGIRSINLMIKASKTSGQNTTGTTKWEVNDTPILSISDIITMIAVRRPIATYKNTQAARIVSPPFV